jgi:hypothetical protein
MRNWLLVGALFLGCALPVGAKPGATAAGGHYWMKTSTFDACFREPADREWHLFFAGEVPVYSWAGAAIVVHDAAGKVIHREVIPRGVYPEEKPYVVTVKADGVTGDYRVVMVGHQIQFIGSCGMVWSDLPFEAYGGARVSVEQSPANKPWFKAPEGVAKMKLGADKGKLRILDKDGKVVADTRLNPMKEKGGDAVEFAVTPGQAYRAELEIGGAALIAYTPERVYLSYEAARWFQPAPELATAKFWKGGAQ